MKRGANYIHRANRRLFEVTVVLGDEAVVPGDATYGLDMPTLGGLRQRGDELESDQRRVVGALAGATADRGYLATEEGR